MKTSIQEINNQGVVHFLNQNFDEAKNKYDEALTQDPNNTAALNNLGLLYLQQKKYKEAEELFRKALELSENETYALNLGHSLLHQNQPIQAENFYLKSIELKKTNLKAWESLVSLYEYTNQLQKAIDTLETIILTIDYQIFFKIKLAKILIKTEKHKDALDLLLNCLEQKGHEAEIFYYISLIHFKNQNFGLAKTAIQNSLTFSPFWDLSLELAATVALYLSDNDLAIDFWDKTLKINPMNHTVRINKSILLINKKEQQLALNELEYVLNFEPKNPKALYYKALLFLEEKSTFNQGEKILHQLTLSQSDYTEKATMMLNNIIKQNKSYVD